MNNKINQKGVVSFFTVIFLSVLLIVITTAFIRLMIGSQRRAIDNDLSTRAYYAAEAGVADALVELREAAKNDDLDKIDTDCTSKSLSNPQTEDFDIEYTCKLISVSEADSDDVTELTGDLGEGSAENIFDGVPGVAEIKISWHIPSEDGALTGVPSAVVGINKENWGGAPAIMRSQIVRYPTTGSITSFAADGSNILNNAVFAYPVRNSADSSINISSSNGAGKCNYSLTGSDYACEVTINGFSGGSSTATFLRLRAINNGAHYKVVALDSSGNPIQIPNLATIDVTGRAGDVYRRIRIKAVISGPSTPGDSSNEFDINYALLVDEDICKDMEVDPDTNAATDNCFRPNP